MPSASCCFLLVFTSQKIHIKQSPNSVKLFGDFFGPEENLGAKEAPGGGPWGTQPTSARQRPLARPGGLWGTWGSPAPPLRSRNTQILSKPYGESTKNNSSCRKFQNHEIQSRALFRHSAGGEHGHGGVYPPHWCSSDDA